MAVVAPNDRRGAPNRRQQQQRPEMHDLLIKVLDGRQLSKAGQLFSISDYDVISDLHTALAKLKQIFNGDGYDQDANSQSVVEICLARITSAIRLVIVSILFVEASATQRRRRRLTSMRRRNFEPV